MANIPNSSRYRTAGNKPSAKTGAANGTGSARNGHNAHDWPVNQTTGNNWLVGLVGLVAIGLLIAFPRMPTCFALWHRLASPQSMLGPANSPGLRSKTPRRSTDIKFIAQPDRLNVMLSRPKRVLVIVGCWDYLSACVAEVSAATDAHGNYNDPEYGPFKRTLEELDAMFKGGRALKISVAEALK